jgi:hypothetical protein
MKDTDWWDLRIYNVCRIDTDLFEITLKNPENLRKSASYLKLGREPYVYCRDF